MGDLDPHWHFGRVVFPNYETTQMGSLGPPKVGIGSYHVQPHLGHWENWIINIFSLWGRGLTPFIVHRGPLTLPLVVSIKDEIGPQNPLHWILTLCNSKALEGDVHYFFEN